MFIVPSVFKGTTINKKMRLDHDSLRRPETSILKWLGYISTDGLSIVQHSENVSKDDHYKKKFTLEVTLPDDFPKKYHKAILAAANTCTVKKVIQAMPEFDITIV